MLAAERGANDARSAQLRARLDELDAAIGRTDLDQAVQRIMDRVRHVLADPQRIEQTRAVIRSIWPQIVVHTTKTDPPGDRACQRRARDGAVFHNWIRTLPRRVIPLVGVVALHSRGQRGERLDLELILHQPDLIGSRRGSGRAGLHTSVHSCWNHSHFSRGRRAPLGASGQRAVSSSPLSSSSSGVVRV